MQESTTRPGRAGAIVILFACLTYLLALVAISVLLWTFADQWWPATALSFAPLWVTATPMILLLPLAILWHRKSLLTLAAAGAVVAWPIMGLEMTWRAAPVEDRAASLRVMTCNMHRTQMNAGEFAAVLDDLRPDVVALQDWTSADQARLFPAATWNTHRDGELFLASRFPIIETQWIALNEPPPVNFTIRLGAAACYHLLTPLGEVRLINLHLSSPHAALDELEKFNPASPAQLAYNSRCRDLESATVEQFVENLNDPVLIMGDFNTPIQSTLYRRYWDSLSNAFSAVGFGFGTTHFSASSSIRIDHILLSDGWRARACWIGPAVGSPHRPLVADLQPTGDLLLHDSTADAGR